MKKITKQDKEWINGFFLGYQSRVTQEKETIREMKKLLLLLERRSEGYERI